MPSQHRIIFSRLFFADSYTMLIAWTCTFSNSLVRATPLLSVRTLLLTCSFCVWCVGVDMLNKLFLTSILAFFPPNWQIPVGMIFTILYLELLLLSQPYVRGIDDRLHVLSQCYIFLGLGFGFMVCFFSCDLHLFVRISFCLCQPQLYNDPTALAPGSASDIALSILLLLFTLILCKCIALRSTSLPLRNFLSEMVRLSVFSSVVMFFYHVVLFVRKQLRHQQRKGLRLAAKLAGGVDAPRDSLLNIDLDKIEGTPSLPPPFLCACSKLTCNVDVGLCCVVNANGTPEITVSSSDRRGPALGARPNSIVKRQQSFDQYLAETKDVPASVPSSITQPSSLMFDSNTATFSRPNAAAPHINDLFSGAPESPSSGSERTSPEAPSASAPAIPELEPVVGRRASTEMEPVAGRRASSADGGVEMFDLAAAVVSSIRSDSVVAPPAGFTLNASGSAATSGSSVVEDSPQQNSVPVLASIPTTSAPEIVDGAAPSHGPRPSGMFDVHAITAGMMALPVLFLLLSRARSSSCFFVPPLFRPQHIDCCFTIELPLPPAEPAEGAAVAESPSKPAPAPAPAPAAAGAKKAPPPPPPRSASGKLQTPASPKATPPLPPVPPRK
jgi:hypothetical protein